MRELIAYAKKKSEEVWLYDGYTCGRYDGLVEGLEHALAELGDKEAQEARAKRTR